jgi:hypothetical protein
MTKLKTSFDYVYGQMAASSGVHVKMKRQLESAFADGLIDIASDMMQADNRRTRPRTWKDRTANTLFM